MLSLYRKFGAPLFFATSGVGFSLPYEVAAGEINSKAKTELFFSGDINVKKNQKVVSAMKPVLDWLTLELSNQLGYSRLVLLKTKSKFGITQYTFIQVINDLPIVNTHVSISVDDSTGEIIKANKKMVNSWQFDSIVVNPLIDKMEALKRTFGIYSHGRGFAVPPQIRLVYIPQHKQKKLIPAYEIKMVFRNPYQSQQVYVDIERGELIKN